MQTATELLREGGLRALTIEAVAAQADVAVQTVYNRVGGRDALLLALAEQALEDNARFMEQAFNTVGTPDDRVRATVAAYAQFASECPVQFQVLADPPDVPKALESIADIMEIRIEGTRRILADGVAAGVYDTDIDQVAMARALWGMLNGLLAVQWRSDRLRADAEMLERMLAAATNLFISGLRPTATR